MMAAHWKQAMRMQSGGVPRVAANGTCHAPPGSSGSNKSVDLALLASLSDRGVSLWFCQSVWGCLLVAFSGAFRPVSGAVDVGPA